MVVLVPEIFLGSLYSFCLRLVHRASYIIVVVFPECTAWDISTGQRGDVTFPLSVELLGYLVISIFYPVFYTTLFRHVIITSKGGRRL